MNTVTSQLQQGIYSLCVSLKSAFSDCKRIQKVYFATDAQSKVSALILGGTASNEHPLSKSDFISGITLAEQITKFFNNESLSQADYLETVLKVNAGEKSSGSVLSNNVEWIANTLKKVTETLLSANYTGQALIDLYNDSELSTAVASLSDETIVYGSEMSVAELKSGITMLSNLITHLNNGSATQGDYQATLEKWLRF